MKKMVKRTLLAASVAAAVGAMGNAWATNGYELIGIGSYQMGMAGAVVAAPGSAMTANTNPAGLADIAPQADFSLEAFSPDRHVNFKATGGQKQKSDVSMYGIPALGWVAPVAPGSNIYFGGGAYGTSGLGVDYPQTMYSPVTNPMAPPSSSNPPLYFRGYSSLSVMELAPAVAMKLNDRLSVGFALNIGYLQASFLQQIVSGGGNTSPGTVLQGVNMTRSSSAFGLGATLGVLYKVNRMWTVGAAYTSEQRFELKYNLAPGDITVNAMPYPGGRYTLVMKTPQMFAVGATAHINPSLSVSGQIKYIGWKHVMNSLSVTGPKNYNGFTPKWKDQTAYALAVNYKVNPALQVRAGINYAKSPIRSNEVGYNLILPAVVETHYTAGVSYQINKHWGIGGALMYAPKKTYTAPMTTSQTNPNKGQKIDLSESAVSFNLKYVF